MEKRILQILNELKSGEININPEDVRNINSICVRYLNGNYTNMSTIRDILEISNILYNNTSREMLPLEDGVYDLVIAKYNKQTGNNAPVGATPVAIDTSDNVVDIDKNTLEDEPLLDIIAVPDKRNMWYFDQIAHNVPYIKEDFAYNEDNTIIDDIQRRSAHSYPELVGTLHKCKFVTQAEAEESGADKNESVMVFERDFLYPTFYNAYMTAKSKNNPVALIAELKYDGVSIEMEVAGDSVISAVSRGDTANDEASDFTPIFDGFKFARARNVDPSTKFGIKFEAIITYDNLLRMKEIFGKTYKNARVAIIGILGSRDARKYRDFITLVPIRTAGLGITDPVQDVEFLNRYYSNGVNMKYAILSAPTNISPMECYNSLLYQSKKFKEEAEYMRSYLNFMYDGVVISYTDPDVKNALGRKNSIDLWSMAIKFNASQKNTYFYGYKYTVGQDGRVTPMAYFAPVEFNGSIHDKTTVHSYKRFKNLSLKVGDIVSVKYVNDVICYLTKPDIRFNDENPNPVVEFPETCPSCGSQLMISDSGDTVYCPNIHCEARQISRVSNMLKKLNIKGFSRAYLKKLNVVNLNSFLNLKKEDTIPVIGEVMSNKLFERIRELKEKPYPDYRLVGSIGFTSVSADRWKTILSVISLENIISSSDRNLEAALHNIKGIGETMAKTIASERDFMMEDLKTIASMPNVKRTFGTYRDLPQVRFTGFRDKDLEAAFNKLGFDADGNKSVTSKTAILLIPYEGYTSAKISKLPYGATVLTRDAAWEYIKSNS